LPDPFECPIVLGLASRVRERVSLARGTMIGAVAGLAMSLGDVCTLIYYRRDKPYNNNYNKSEAGNPFFNSE
jgi:hypothetical protein